MGAVVPQSLRKQGRKLYIDAGKDLKIHKISKSVTYSLLTHYLLKKIDLEMLQHLKSVGVLLPATVIMPYYL